MERNNAYMPVRVIFSLLSVAIMVIIFMFSCENSDESSDTSGTFTIFIAEHFVSDFDTLSSSEQEEVYGKIDHIVRKCAHFSVYTSLGFCLSTAVGRRRLFSPGSLLALGVSFLYACSDEIHQSFVPGRACMFTDVLIDTSGALTGMLISLVLITAVYAVRLHFTGKSTH